MRFRKGDLCAFKTGGGVKAVLVRKDVQDTDTTACIDECAETSVNNLFFLCHTDAQSKDPYELMGHNSVEITLNLAGILMSLRAALDHPHLVAIVR
jgi:hypothetical protein